MTSTFTKHICTALMGVAILSSCSRPVAYFQRGPVNHYNTPKTETVAVATPAEVAQPAEVVAPAPVAAATPAPAEQIAQANATMSQIEAYVRNDSKLATDKKLNKRMDRVKTMLATATEKASLAPNATTSPKKATLLERMATKRIDKQIKNKLSPERTMAKSLLTIGLIVGVIGLILILVGSGAIGVIALIVGLALILVDLLQ
jgi:DMSO reductase anchor subunit